METHTTLTFSIVWLVCFSLILYHIILPSAWGFLDVWQIIANGVMCGIIPFLVKAINTDSDRGPQ